MPADRSKAAWRQIVPILLVAAITLAALALVSEGAARLLFTQSTTSTMKCLIATDPATGVRGIPGSVCQQKIFESPLVDYRYNDCGYRTPQVCRAAPAGTYRIVLVGSSLSYGMHIAQPLSFASLLGPMLSERLGRPIDVFNESMQWGVPASVALRTASMLVPHPDMILWTLTPFDIENGRMILPYIPGVQVALVAGGLQPDPAAVAPADAGLMQGPERAWRHLIRSLSDTRTVFALQHYLFRSQSQYLTHTFAQGHEIDYLRTPVTPALQDNLAFFAQSFATVAARAKAAGVPLVVTLLPSRAQTIMLADRSWDAGYDPDQLGRLLRPIVEAEGAQYIDMTQGLAAHGDAGQLYFSVDEHLPPEGHQMLATLLADALARSGTIHPAEPRR